MAGAHLITFSNLSGSGVSEGEIAPALAKEGIVLFKRGDREQLGEFLGRLAHLRDHPHAAPSGETLIEPQQTGGSPGAAGFSQFGLAPHTDRALMLRPPTLVAVLIEQAASYGGQSLVADASPISRLADGLAARSLVLEAEGNGRFPVLETHMGLVRVRFRDDEVARPCAEFNGGLRVLVALRAIIAQAAQLPLTGGEGYIVHNHRVLHGRTAFRGYRRALWILADIRPGHPYAWLNDGFREGCAMRGG